MSYETKCWFRESTGEWVSEVDGVMYGVNFNLRQSHKFKWISKTLLWICIRNFKKDSKNGDIR